jgi:hypothetical protein
LVQPLSKNQESDIGMAVHKQLRERTYLTANQPAQVNRHPEESPVTQAPEQPVAGRTHGIAESVRRLNDVPNPVARQQIFRSLATRHGNSYASKVATVMRDKAKPAAAPDELDSLLGLSEHRSHYNDQQLQQARQLAEAESDPAKRSKLFKLLQTKVTYYNQNKNTSKGFNSNTHATWDLGIGMCNVTSLAMALEGIGVTFSHAKATFPDTYQKYKAVLLSQEKLSMEDRQKWVAATSEATRFPDFLEQLRVVNRFGWLTQGETWRKLAGLFGVKLEFITIHAGRHPKQWWLDNVQTAFEAGESIVLGVQNHIIRLQEINDHGLVLDDPNGSTNLGKGMTTRSGHKLDFSWDSYQTSGDTLVPWDVAENYNFWWVYKLKGAGAIPGRAAAKKPAQSTQVPATPQSVPSKPTAAPAAPAPTAPSKPTAAPAATQEVLNRDEQLKALVAMKQAAAAGMSQNKVIDQGYFAIRGVGKIDPANKQAVAEWLFIKDNLLPVVGKAQKAASVTPGSQSQSAESEGGIGIVDMFKKLRAKTANSSTSITTGRAAPGTAGVYQGADGKEGYVVYQDEIKVGGTLAWRNNNPGNIEAVGKVCRENGALYAKREGINTRFGIFPDEQSGMKAIVALLHKPWFYNLTVLETMKKYAPMTDGNDPVAYANSITKMTGVDTNRVLNTLSDDEFQSMARAIKRVEGWKPGTIYRRGESNLPGWAAQLLGV